MPTVSKRVITAVAAMALTVAVAGCSSSDDKSSSSGDKAATTKSLDVWVMGDDANNFSEAAKGFTAKTGIKINAEAIPWDGVSDKLTTAVASGDGPDVMQIGLSFLPAFQAAGALMDLTPYLDKAPGLESSNFLASLASDKLDPSGKVTSLPWVADTRVLFYRTDLLAEAEVTPPTTWEELHAAATKLAQRGKGKYGYYIPQWDAPLPVQFTWQAGGEVSTSDGKVDFSGPEFQKAVDYYLSFYRDGLAPEASDFDQTQGFISGAVPILISGPYLASALKDQAPELDGKWAVSTLPKDQTGTALMAGSNLGVWHKSENAEAAVQLIEYLDAPEQQLAWYQKTSELPTTTAALDDPSLAQDPNVAVYVQQMEDSKLLPLAASWDQIASELLKSLNDIALNGADEDKTLASLNDTVAKLQQ